MISIPTIEIILKVIRKSEKCLTTDETQLGNLIN
jgi:hypothetical protein